MGTCASVGTSAADMPSPMPQWMSAVGSWRYARYQPTSDVEMNQVLFNCDLLRLITSYQPGVCRMIRYIFCRWKRQTGPYAKAHFIVYTMPPNHAIDRLYILTQIHTAYPRALSRTLMDLFSKAGYLECVQYMHEHYNNGCSRNAMDLAAASGHLHVVAFLHQNRSEGCSTDAMDFAAAGGHLDVVEFLFLNRTEGCTAQALQLAAANGHLKMVEFLLGNCKEMLSTQGTTIRSVYRHEWLSLKRSGAIRAQDSQSTSTIYSEDDEDDEDNKKVALNPLDLALLYGQSEVAKYLHNDWGYTCSSPDILKIATLRGHRHAVSCFDQAS